MADQAAKASKAYLKNLTTHLKDLTTQLYKAKQQLSNKAGAKWQQWRGLTAKQLCQNTLQAPAYFASSLFDRLPIMWQWLLLTTYYQGRLPGLLAYYLGFFLLGMAPLGNAFFKKCFTQGLNGDSINLFRASIAFMLGFQAVKAVYMNALGYYLERHSIDITDNANSTLLSCRDKNSKLMEDQASKTANVIVDEGRKAVSENHKFTTSITQSTLSMINSTVNILQYSGIALGVPVIGSTVALIAAGLYLSMNKQSRNQQDFKFSRNNLQSAVKENLLGANNSDNLTTQSQVTFSKFKDQSIWKNIVNCFYSIMKDVMYPFYAAIIVRIYHIQLPLKSHTQQIKLLSNPGNFLYLLGLSADGPRDASVLLRSAEKMSDGKSAMALYEKAAMEVLSTEDPKELVKHSKENLKKCTISPNQLPQQLINSIARGLQLSIVGLSLTQTLITQGLVENCSTILGQAFGNSIYTMYAAASACVMAIELGLKAFNNNRNTAKDSSNPAQQKIAALTAKTAQENLDFSILSSIITCFALSKPFTLSANLAFACFSIAMPCFNTVALKVLSPSTESVLAKCTSTEIKEALKAPNTVKKAPTKKGGIPSQLHNLFFSNKPRKATNKQADQSWSRYLKNFQIMRKLACS